LGVPDELEEVVGNEFDLCEELFSPGPEVAHVAYMREYECKSASC